MSRKNAFIAKQKNCISRKLYELSAKDAFSRTKTFLLHKPFLAGFKNRPFSQTKSLAFTQTFSYSHQKQLFSTLHLPFQRPLTYCPPKNTAVLLISALNPYAVKPERRTDSNHCRRCPENCSFQHSRLLDERRSFSQKHRIDRRFESSPESRGSQTSGVLLVLFVHAKRINPFSLSGKLRGFANLKSARRNGSFAPQQLKPF